MYRNWPYPSVKWVGIYKEMFFPNISFSVTTNNNLLCTTHTQTSLGQHSLGFQCFLPQSPAIPIPTAWHHRIQSHLLAAAFCFVLVVCLTEDTSHPHRRHQYRSPFSMQMTMAATKKLNKRCYTSVPSIVILS